MITSFIQTPAEHYDALILGLKIAAAILATLWLCRTLLDAEDFRQAHRERNRNEHARRREENLSRVNLYATEDPNWPIYPVDLPSDRLLRHDEAKRLAAVIAISDRRRA